MSSSTANESSPPVTPEVSSIVQVDFASLPSADHNKQGAGQERCDHPDAGSPRTLEAQHPDEGEVAAGSVMSTQGGVQLTEEFLRHSIAQCITKHDSHLALLCLEQGEDPHIRCVNTGRTLFHLVAMSANPMTEVKFVPLVYVLSNAGVDLDIVDFSDVTPLQLSIRYRLLEVMTALLKCGAEVRGDEEKLAERHCQLFVAEYVTVLRKLSPGYWHLVQHNKTFAVNVLVKSWCRVNLSRKGQSLIEFAKQTPAVDPKLVKHLVDNEASIELAHAVMAGDGQRVQYLMCNQAVDLQTSDLSHKENFFQPFQPLTLYGAALKYGHKHLLHLLRRNAIYRPSTSDDTMKASSDERPRAQTDASGLSTSAVCVVL